MTRAQRKALASLNHALGREREAWARLGHKTSAGARRALRDIGLAARACEHTYMGLVGAQTCAPGPPYPEFA